MQCSTMSSCSATTKVKDTSKDAKPCLAAGCDDATCCKVSPAQCSTMGSCSTTTKVKDTSKDANPCLATGCDDATCCKEKPGAMQYEEFVQCYYQGEAHQQGCEPVPWCRL